MWLNKNYEEKTERVLSYLSKKLVLLKNLFYITLTTVDYNDYLIDTDSANVENFISFYEEE